ncbi:unannotated protein [freshwater metagenome]|uniref:Unannotated protein n=1 Tax=freshwater metagenome TaxID=449393 RepID=A0A6J7R3Q3_9ZZZZ
MCSGDLRHHCLHSGHPKYSREQRCINEARADRVDANAAPAVIDGEVLGEYDYPTLRRVVSAAAFSADKPLNAREIHDRSALRSIYPKAWFLLEHRGGRVFIY